MFSRIRIAAVLSFASVASADLTTRPTPVVEEPATWIARLMDRDPRIRREAYLRLDRPGARIDTALWNAVRDPRPAIADPAAELLLHYGRWFQENDPPNVRLTLSKYTQADPAARAKVLTDLVINGKLTNFRHLTLRTLARDPAPLVAWLVLNEVEPDGGWEQAILAVDPDGRPRTLPTAALVLRARCREWAGDQATAVALAREALDAERTRPTASADLLSWAFQAVITADTAAGRYADAAGRMRDQSIRTADDDERSLLLDRLLDLHIRHGPLPRLADDVRDSEDSVEGHATAAVALLADRIGLPILGGALLGTALREDPGETDGDRAARLFEAAESLQAAGHFDAACRVYDQVAATHSEAARGRVTVALARLSDLHVHAGRPALAGYCLQQAINRQDGPMANTRNGQPEVWTVEDQQACVYWYYLLDARQRKDSAATHAFARLVLDAGSTNGGIFLDVAQDLPAVASPAEIDAYFTRTFEQARTRLIEAPDHPMYNNDIAWLCARSGRKPEEAAKWAERAVELAPNESAYLDTLAEARFRSGRVQEAIELETRALSLQPDEDVFMSRQLARFRAAATQPAR